MAVAPVSSTSSAQSAFGLDFQSMLQIILTQLKFQDPLQPLDNFQFVSQLGQFAQLQQSQSLNDQITTLLSGQAAAQATGLLGKTIDALSTTGSTSTTTGQVTAVSFPNGTPQLTIQTSDGQTVTGISISDVTQVR